MGSPTLLMSMPDYYATLQAIGTNPSCAPMLADKFEEAGLDWHADYFRYGYRAPRPASDLVNIIMYYGVPDMRNRNERFTASLCYILIYGTRLIERISTFDLAVVTTIRGLGYLDSERLVDYNLVGVLCSRRY